MLAQIQSKAYTNPRLDLQEIPQTLAGNLFDQKYSHLQPSTTTIFTMRYFTINKIVNVIGAILFVIMGIFLITGFALNLSIVDELQQASNFDNWKYFILGRFL